MTAVVTAEFMHREFALLAHCLRDLGEHNAAKLADVWALRHPELGPMPPPPLADWITVIEAAVLCGVDDATVYKWNQKGRVVSRVADDGHLRIQSASLPTRKAKAA